MGRKELPEDEKKDQYWVYISKKIANALGRDRMKEIAVKAIEKEYKKSLKNRIT